MSIRSRLTKLVSLIAISAVLMALLACASDEPAAPVPTGPSAEEIAKIVSDAAPTGPSAEEIARLVSDSVSRAVADAVPEGTSAQEIQRMVEAAVVASSQPGITRAQVEAAVTASVQSATAGQLTAAEVQRIVDASVKALPAPQMPEIDISAIRGLVQQAVTDSVPEGVSADEIAKLVEAAVGASTAGVPTRDELTKSIEDAVKGAAAGQLTAAEVQRIVDASLMATEAAAMQAQKAAEEAAKAAGGAAMAAEGAAKAADGAAMAAKEAVEQRTKKVLRISSGQDIRTFTPYPSESGTMLRAFGLIYSNLVSVDPINVNFAPDLAEHWEYAPDGSSITFFLRKGALFHDGTPVTAKDVAFSIELNLDPAIGRGQLTSIKGGEAYRAGETDSIPGVVIIDDHTIRFDFEKPTGTFLNQLVDLRSTFPILPEHILGKIEPRSSVGTDEFFLKPIGSGAFKLVDEVIAGQGFTLEAFDDYYFGRPKIDEITFRVITSGDAAWIALLRGDIDYAVRTNFGKDAMRRFDSALNDPRFHAAGAESLAARGIYLVNTRLDHFKDPRVMQAMVHALDRNAMNEAFFSGQGVLVNSPIHVGEVKNREDLLPLRYPYDPDKARQLLEDAGWDFDRVVPTIAYTGQMESRPEFMAAIVQYLADVGFKMELEILDDPWARFRTWNTDSPGGGEVSLTGTPMWPNPDTWLNLMIHSSGWNGAGYASPEMDAKIEAARGVLTESERTMLYQDIALELQEKLPSAWITPSPGAIFLHNKRWYVPFFASQPRPASTADIFYAPIKTNGADWWKFHVEQWDIIE